MKYLRTEENKNYYEYICEGCQAEGELGVQAGSGDFSCPEECGARYVQWENPLTSSPDLMCVVCPVFVDEDEPRNFADEDRDDDLEEYFDDGSPFWLDMDDDE